MPRAMRRDLAVLGLLLGAACQTPLPYSPGQTGAPAVPQNPELSVALSAGLAQSPIDIHTDALQAFGRHGLPALEFGYGGNVTVDLVNTGAPEEEATVRANVPAGAGSLTVDGVTYRLVQFHWHTPAEHEVDGVRLPLEVHFVHQALDGTLMVVGVLMRPGRTNPELVSLFGHLPEEEDGHAVVDHVNLKLLLPPLLASYRYAGSLTTAPYAEGVRWVVLAQPLELGAAQLEEFQALFPHGNSREVQPLNGRVVSTDLP